MKRNNNRITTGLTLFMATLLAGGQAVAKVNLSQQPLFVGKSVPPNIMFMIDDSGSMQWEIMPNEKQFEFGGGGRFGPAPYRYMYDPEFGVYGGNVYASRIPGTDEDSDTGAFYRSPHNNTLYYDPEVNYKPWVKADATAAEPRMDDADPGAAYHNPARPGVGTRDLTAGICNDPDDYTFQRASTGDYFLNLSENEFDKIAGTTFYERNVQWEFQRPGGWRLVESFEADEDGDYVKDESESTPGNPDFDEVDRPYERVCPDVTNALYYEYGGSGDVTDADNYTRVVIEPSNAPFDGGPNRTDCAASAGGPSQCTYDEEIQNYANWYTYHRSATLAARAGIGQAFGRQEDNIRVGYGTINTSDNLQGVREFKGQDREDFFDSLYGDPVPIQGTPLRSGLDDLGLDESVHLGDDAGRAAGAGVFGLAIDEIDDRPLQRER